MSSGYSILGTNPLPLTFHEEIKHLTRWKDNKDPRSLEVLVKNYLLFTVKKVKRMYQHLPQDAVMLIAHRTLLQSINGFDPKRSKVGRLSSLIPWFAREANQEYIRESETVRLPTALMGVVCFVSLDAVKVWDDGFEDGYEKGLINFESSADASFDNVFDCSHSALDEDLRREKKASLLSCLQRLSFKQRRIIEKVYFKNMTYAQIAREASPPITREAVRQQHTKALHRLREVVQKTNLVYAE